MAAARKRFEEFKARQMQIIDQDPDLQTEIPTSQMEVEIETCSLCMEALESDYGYVAHITTSKVLGKQVGNPEQIPYLSQGGGLHIATCGHKIHITCFANFIKSAPPFSGNVRFIPNEFLCHMCKYICNIFVPVISAEVVAGPPIAVD
jgi:hypothetical protein